MPAISVDAQIKKILPLLGNEEKQSLLTYIKSLVTAKEMPKRLTKEEFIIQYNKELNEAEARINAGHFISQEDLEKESETW